MPGPGSRRACCGPTTSTRRLGDGLPAEVALGLPAATIADIDRARGIVVLGVDLKEELPVLYLRARRAAEELDVPLVEISATPTGLASVATACLRHAPGEQAETASAFVSALGGTASGDAEIDAAAAALSGRGGDLVVIVGRGNLAESTDPTVAALARLRAVPDVRFLVALRRANVRGALELGLAPGFLPGRVTLEDGREWFEDAWGAVPAETGLDALAILDAAANGRIDVLILVGADPHDDCPDRELADARTHRRTVRDRGRHLPDGQQSGRRRLLARDRLGRAGGLGHQRRGARRSASRAESRQTAPRCPTGASRPSWPSVSARTSISRPPPRSRTRSRASRPRLRGRRRRADPARPRWGGAPARRSRGRGRPRPPVDPVDPCVVGADRSGPRRRRSGTPDRSTGSGRGHRGRTRRARGHCRARRPRRVRRRRSNGEHERAGGRGTEAPALHMWSGRGLPAEIGSDVTPTHCGS